MGSVLDFYNTDQIHSIRLTSSSTLTTHDGFEINFKLFSDFSSGSIYPVFLVPTNACKLNTLSSLLQQNNLQLVLQSAPGMAIQPSTPSGYETETSSLKFCGRIYIYTEIELTITVLESIKQIAKKLDLVVECFGPSWAKDRSYKIKPSAFLSHDSRDKELIARPLVSELSKLLVPIWYDEYSLKIGDSLRDKIEQGIKECKRCILIISPNFINNSGWTKREFDSIFTRELLDTENIILPVWAGVSKRDVFNYSPSLADRVALNLDEGVETIASKLSTVLKESPF